MVKPPMWNSSGYMSLLASTRQNEAPPG